MVTDNTPKIRIAHIITRMDWGGSPDIARLICQGLDAEKYELTFITGPSENPTGKTDKFFEQLKERLVIVPSLRRDINLFLDAAAFFTLYGICKKGNFDIVHTHTAKAGFLGRIAGRLAGVKRIVHTTHGHNLYGYFNPLLTWFIVQLEKMAASFTSKAIVLTKLEKKDLVNAKIFSESKVIAADTAVDFSQTAVLDAEEKKKRRKSLGLAQEGLLIGMVARLEPIKGIDYFMQAAIQICQRYPDVSFVCAGEGSLKQRITENISTAGLDKRILLLGWRDDAMDIISVLDILVLSSLNEAVGLVLIEAQGQGVPVIATNVGGIPEVVQDGVTGILVAPTSATQLAEAMRQLIDNAEKRKKMGESARLFVRNKFSPEKLVQSVSEVYEELLRKK